MSSPIMSKSALTQRLKEVVVNVNMFCLKHFPHEGSFSIANLTAEATGYSRTTVYNVLKEYNTSEVLKENVEKELGVSIFKPKTVLKRKSAVVDIDDFDQCAIRRIVHQFHIAQGALPTIKGILQKAREDLEFSGSLSSMRKIVQNLGISWKKTETNRRILMERNDIRGLRIEFLRKITKFREEARPIVFMDETYIHAGHLSGKSWSDGSVNGVKCFISKGARAIIVHAGGDDAIALAKQTFSLITKEDWQKVCEKSRKFEQSYTKSEIIIDEVADLVINIGEVDDSSDEDELYDPEDVCLSP